MCWSSNIVQWFDSINHNQRFGEFSNWFDCSIFLSNKFDCCWFTTISMSNQWNLVTTNSNVSKFESKIINITMHIIWSISVPISCRIPSLPHRARYTNLLSTDEWMSDSSFLEYVCGNSRYRQRIFCRQGKILPRLPRCFYGKMIFVSILIFFFIVFFRLSSKEWNSFLFENILSSSRKSWL